VYKVSGEILNTGNEKKEEVRIVAVFYDKDNVIFGVAWTTIKCPKPNDSRSFVIEYKLGTSDIDNYELFVRA